MNRRQFKKTFLLLLIGALCGFAISYPYDFLNREYLEAWSNVEKMDSIYQGYVKQHGREPQDLSFLPEEVRTNMDCPEYPVQYNHETGLLSSRVPFGKYDLIDYLLGRKIDSVSVRIGYIGGREQKGEE